MNIKPYHLYWGKLKQRDGSLVSFHRLVYHSLDVAAVAYCFLRARSPFSRDIAQFLGIGQGEFCRVIALIVALHDLGKFASAFQGLVQHETPTLFRARPRRTYDSRTAHHDRLGYVFWQRLKVAFLSKVTQGHEFDRREEKRALAALTVLMECSLGHHGQPVNTMQWEFLEQDYTEDHNLEAASEFSAELFRLMPATLSPASLVDVAFRRRLQQISWHIAGVVVLADWLGSNQEYFSYEHNVLSLEEYWPSALNSAHNALRQTELASAPAVNPFRSFDEHFQFAPTPLQKWAETVAVDSTPQLFILEDMTGAGKTEAALVLTHRLLQAGAADGFYFGLPTMATSNAMFGRVADYYLNMLRQEDGSAPSIVLAHAARDMHVAFQEARMAAGGNDGAYSNGDETVTIQCNQWLSDSRKKALLAPVGVGTLDQPLLAVLPRKHQSLRLLGLSRKVLIFDEVHAADSYMFELLDSLLTLHLHQGGSAILLTATLPLQQRQRLINIWLRVVQAEPFELQSTAFPLASSVNLSKTEKVAEVPVAVREGAERSVVVRFVHEVDACIATVINAALQGKSVVWIRNTVADAVAAYQRLKQGLPCVDSILLFHSRFVLYDRQRIEAKVLEWLGKSSDATVRTGRIIVTTQVFQESLDADADVMVSDLCPIDDLIQRAGRLHRHRRDAAGRYAPNQSDAREPPVLWVYAPEWTDQPSPDWLTAEFSGTQAVYRSPGRLWLGMRVLRELGGMHMPVQARTLIEAVYGEDAYERMPPALREVEHEVIGEERSKQAAGKFNALDWQQGYTLAGRANWHEDETDISTRFIDVETDSVLLLQRSGHGLRPWILDDVFSWQLSTVRLPRNSYASKLSPLPDSVGEAWEHLCEQNRQLKFLKPWLPEEDHDFAYDSVIGVHRKDPA